MKRIFRAALALWLAAAGTAAMAQETFPRNGVQDERLQRYAFTGATIVVDPQTTLQNATLLIEDGKVKAVGSQVRIPAGTIVQELNGAYIYPGLIDLYSSYGLPVPPRASGSWNDPPQLESNTEGPYNWNQAIRAEYEAVRHVSVAKEEAKILRAMGFSSALTHYRDGIARGTGTLLTLAEDDEQNIVLKARASAHLSFDKGTSRQNYPSSLMGSIALLRQTYLDAAWYAGLKEKPFTDQSLMAFENQRSLPQIFEAGSVLNALRADKLGDEFGIQYIIRGKGDEYQRLEAVKATGAAFILPLDFPVAYEVEDPFDELNVSLAEMKHWELAPYNAALLAEAGVSFAFTTDGLMDKQKFWANLRKAIQHGLSKEQALAALTTTPARLLGMEKEVGNLKAGAWANFLISSDELWKEEVTIYENWIKGEPYRLAPIVTENFLGNYQLSLNEEIYPVRISGTPAKPDFKLMESDTSGQAMTAKISDKLITLTFNPNPKDSAQNQSVRLSGWRTKEGWQGSGRRATGEALSFSLRYESPLKAEEKKEEPAKDEAIARGETLYPFVAYGHTPATAPRQHTILFTNATVWTNEAEGILENADVLVVDGKISQVGKGLKVPSGAEVIDATGKHLTSGIIDEHSHIAISRGVNEGSQSVTAEVRIGDVVDSEDINIYRQLAGGVTASQLLHGSANAIGGQSALIKLRWGKTPEEMKIEQAPEFIKFALGENVKQSNWGPTHTVRFPQTRMGTEQVMADAFTRAQAYEQAWKQYNSLGRKQKTNTPAPRRDLELEALVEILNDERYITSHSYVQSEINMLMKVAEQFDFNINTFTHILEGYKLADKMKAHGVGGSTFADWWVYKMEVQEAIPYNAALMHNEGVVVAINSDDAEMGRRLNQEAAKTVKYGSMSEEEAWKTVTLNPAKLLHLDDHMGSIKAGKDADLVLWNGNPLAVYSRPLKTLVDGIAYYDAERDAQLREEIQAERTRLINLMRESKQNGNKTQPVVMKTRHLWHCEDLGK